MALRRRKSPMGMGGEVRDLYIAKRQGDLDLYRIDYGDAGEAPEVCDVEGKDIGHGIDLHDGNQVGICASLPITRCLPTSCSHAAATPDLPSNRRKRPSSDRTSLAIARGLIASPLLIGGRVATVQNSTRFCGAIQRSACCFRSSATAADAMEYWRC